MENCDFSWKLNPADELDSALREAQISIKEITENRFLTSILKEHLRKTMPPAYYIQVAGMTISEMIQRIPEMWKNLQRDELPEEKRTKNMAITQIVNQENEDQGSKSSSIKTREVETSLKSKKKRRNIQCYDCKERERGHVIKDCPYSPRVIRRENSKRNMS